MAERTVSLTIERRSLVEQTADVLRARIAGGDWPLGGRIPTEVELVAQLGVSRNTVREAVRGLAQAGMLETRQGDGTYVRALADGFEAMRRITRASLRDKIEVRCTLEEAAARLAAARRDGSDVAALIQCRERCAGLLAAGQVDAYIEQDFAFHHGIVAAARNPALSELYVYFSASIRTSIRRSIGDADLPEPSAQQHMAVLDAIIAQDGDAAAQAVRALFAPLLETLDQLLTG